MAGDSPSTNFDDLAKKLADELQGMGVAPAQPPMDTSPLSAQTATDVAPFEISSGNGGITKVVMRHAMSNQSVEVYTYGACVTSWTTRDVEHLWMSELNKWEPGGKAIRGGIPLCFPQFGPYGDLVQHGFARVAPWQIEDTTVNDDGSVSTILLLDESADCEEVRKWPHKFSAEYTLTLSPVGLEAKLSVTNTGTDPMPFTFAFHNYFASSKVMEARVYGTEGVRYNDRLDGDRENPPMEDDGAGLLLTEETDRIYLNAPDELAIFDFSGLKVVKIKKTPTLPNATVWNPFGSEGADPGWEKFICIEPAVVTPAAVVAPGETWVGAQLLGVE